MMNPDIDRNGYEKCLGARDGAEEFIHCESSFVIQLDLHHSRNEWPYIPTDHLSVEF